MPNDVQFTAGAKGNTVEIAMFDKVTSQMLAGSFNPESARLFSELVARAAYEAHYGRPAPDGGLALQAEIKRQATDQLRERLILAGATIARSMIEKGNAPGLIATHIIDLVLQDTAA
jgi:hypothetical protein